MPIARSTIAGVGAGVLMLAGVVGFAVGLPEVAGEGAEKPALPVLPDRIGDRMVALSALDVDDPIDAFMVDPNTGQPYTDANGQPMTKEAFVQEWTSGTAKNEKAAAEHLADLYGQAAFRTYIDVPAAAAALEEGGQQQPVAKLGVTVTEGPAGPPMFAGPVERDEQGTHYALQKIDGYQCAIGWRDPADPQTGFPTGQPATAKDYENVECRAEQDGLAYIVIGAYLLPEEVVDYLEVFLDAPKAESD